MGLEEQLDRLERSARAAEAKTLDNIIQVAAELERSPEATRELNVRGTMLRNYIESEHLLATTARKAQGVVAGLSGESGHVLAETLMAPLIDVAERKQRLTERHILPIVEVDRRTSVLTNVLESTLEFWVVRAFDPGVVPLEELIGQKRVDYFEGRLRDLRLGQRPPSTS